ncbi:MAG: SDR family oxidoreductase [Chitinophagaceae bacterium]
MPTALILGATSDIGIALSRKFAMEGFDIQLAARKIEDLPPLRSDLMIRYNVHCTIYRFDAVDIAQHNPFFLSLSPVPDVTIFVIGYMHDENAAKKNWAETEKILYANYVGAVSILNLTAEHYATRQKGIIVGISSVAGERGRQSNYLYGSAKAGLSAYLSGLRNSLFPFQVHVLTVKPGFVYTRMTENLKLPALLTATPQEVAKAVFIGVKNKKNVIYVKSIWRLIMFVIKCIPEFLFKKLKL